MTDQASLFGEAPPPIEHPVRKDAVLSDDGMYRYELTRTWSDPNAFVTPKVTFVMLNPSTADADVDDPTIRRCMGFARSLGYSGLRVVNLFAYRATEPKAMWDAEMAGVDIVGPDNDRHLRKAFLRAYNGCSPVIAAWGADARVGRFRVDTVRRHAADCGAKLQALAISKAGHPRHPLYLPGDCLPIDWAPR